MVKKQMSRRNMGRKIAGWKATCKKKGKKSKSTQGKKGGSARKRGGGASGKVKDIIREVDVVLVVLDCQDPHGTRNFEIERYTAQEGKVLVFVLNKCDLVDREGLMPMKRRLSGVAPAVFTSAKDKYGIGKLKSMIKRHAPRMPVRVGIVGYPNVGKSMLANALKGKRSAGVSPVAGFTKGQQWLKVSENMLLYDSPGVVDKRAEGDLAIIGAVDPDKCADPVGAAMKILDRVNFENPGEIEKRYGVEFGDGVLDGIAKERGRLKPGGIPDAKAAAIIVIREWNRGKLERFKKKDNEREIADGEPSKKVR